MQQRIGITGGTGLVGNAIAAKLAAAGFQVTIFSRSRKHTFAEGCRIAHWDPARKEMDTKSLGSVTGMIHLAGAGIADHRWTSAYKKVLEDSRIAATLFLQEQLAAHAPQCRHFVAASAVGYYGPDRPEAKLPFQEDAPPYKDFLSRLCEKWEAASKSRSDEMRTVLFRFGIVLSEKGGAYPKLTQAAKLGILPVMGNGAQNMSWIHLHDLRDLLFQAITEENLSGTYNAVAVATAQKEMMREFATALPGIQVLAPVPALFLKIGMGESSVELLKSSTVSNEKIKKTGFSFTYPDITAAAIALAAAGKKE